MDNRSFTIDGDELKIISSPDYEAQSSYSQSRRMKAQAASTELEVVRQVETSYGSMLTSKVSLTSANEAYHSAQLAQEALARRIGNPG